MRRRSAGGLVAVAVAGCLACATPADTPPMIGPHTQARLAAVGRVNLAAVTVRRMCTGTLVAPDLVLTAAHCLVHPVSGAPAAPRDLHFVAGRRKGASSGHGRAEALRLHPDHAPHRPGNDLALMRLRAPIEDIAPLPTGRPGPAAISIPGYRRDRPYALSLRDDCPVLDERPDLLLLGCAVAPGTSGAPVLAGSGADARIVGVVVASSRREGRPVTVAAKIAGRLAALRAQLGPARLPSRSGLRHTR